jgi:hypothetical protein
MHLALGSLVDLTLRHRGLSWETTTSGLWAEGLLYINSIEPTVVLSLRTLRESTDLPLRATWAPISIALASNSRLPSYPPQLPLPSKPHSTGRPSQRGQFPFFCQHWPLLPLKDLRRSPVQSHQRFRRYLAGSFPDRRPRLSPFFFLA